MTHVCCRLYHRHRWRPFAVVAGENADDSFATDGRDFHHVAGFQHGQFRDESSTREVHVVDGFARLMQDALEDERKRFEVRQQILQNLRWQAGEELVPYRVGRYSQTKRLNSRACLTVTNRLHEPECHSYRTPAIECSHSG